MIIKTRVKIRVAPIRTITPIVIVIVIVTAR